MTQSIPIASLENASRPSSATPPPPPLAGEVPERPVRAPKVELVGKMHDAGFQEQHWLIQRDRQFLQVSELLYRVAEQADGEHTLNDIAEAVTAATEWEVTADHVRHILRTKLMPLGLIATADGTVLVPDKEQAPSPLQVQLRKQLIGPRTIEPVARVLQVLFWPPLLMLMLLVIAGAHFWLYFVHGVADSIRVALYTPGGLLLVLGLMITSGIVHEFGHAAALRYGGGKVRGMGTGLYLVYPTFYTDTTDAYRLGRWARVRIDLGGIYFHLLFVLGLMALYSVTRYEILLAVALLINGDILYQLIPFVRLDGYWAVADLTGIPDLFSQMDAFVRGRLPTLKRWVRFAFLTYIVLTLPVLVGLGLFMVLNFPRLVALSWDAIGTQVRMFSMAQSVGDALSMVAVASQIFLLSLSLLAAVYFLFSLARKPAQFLWRWSKPTAPRRFAGALAGAAVLGLVGFLWLPYLPTFQWSVANGPQGTEIYEVTNRLHVSTPVDYDQYPPVGGDHAGIWQNCGFYDTPVTEELAVHSLEHGAVWITYRPDLAQAELESLQQLAQSQNYILVSALPDQPVPLVASAWGRQLRLESTNDLRLEEFISDFRLGWQAPERGGGCTGGIGKPK
jgi:putative peptide zinc metalloprotease protein